MFTTLEESVSYCMHHFTPDSYHCIVGLVGLMGSVTDAVVSQDAVEGQLLMGSRTDMPPRQSTVVALFSATYTTILASPKTGQDSSQDLYTIETFKE